MSNPLDPRFSNVADVYPQALALIRQAIDLLDYAKAPADIAAHLDQAAHRLSDWAGLIP